MDNGCTLIDRRGLDAKISIKFANDGRLEPCEVEEYTLNHWEQFPDAAELLASGPIPWRIQDPLTRKRILETIKLIEEDLKFLRRQGVSLAEEDYVKRQMAGLFLFTLFTDQIQDDKKFREEAEKILEQLQAIGLHRLREYLLSRGGLGVGLMREDASIEATADEALKLKRGWCTERSKILYAVFHEAGLTPFFVNVHGEDLPSEDASLSGKGHVYLGVSLQNKILYADPSYKLLFIEYPHSIRLELIHYLASDLVNRAPGLSKAGRDREEIKVLLDAIHLDPTNSAAHINLGGYYESQGLVDEAIQALREAIRLDPRKPLAWSNLVSMLVKRDDFDEAKRVVEEGLKLHPRQPRLHAAKGSLYYNYGFVFNDQDSFRQAVAAFEQALALDPSNVEVYWMLGNASSRAKELEKAVGAFQTMVKLAPQPLAYSALAQMFVELNRLDEAVMVLEEGLKHNPGEPNLRRHLLHLRQKKIDQGRQGKP